MRIAYLCDEDLSMSSGVHKKILDQIKIWSDRGNEVYLYSLRSKKSDPKKNSRLHNNVFGKFFRHYGNSRNLNSTLLEFNPDIIYIRYIKYAPGLVGALRNHAPYIVEVNTNDSTEFGLKNYWHGLYNRLTRGFLLSNSNGFVAVTNELKDDKCFSSYSIPTVVIANGFSCSEVDYYSMNFCQSQRQQLIFVGSSKMPWHGLDKIYEMAKLIPDFDFHIVGPEISEVEKIGVNLNNLIVYGHLAEREILDLFKKCDVGVSTLALHRIGMNEACPLKSRQYLSYGLPIIIGYKDTDFLNPQEFVLNIGNFENNVSDSIEKIKSFVLNARSLFLIMRNLI